jgi:hypothetical protein
MRMASRIDQEHVLTLLKRLALNDREVGELIGVHQTTIWRLRHRKIRKLDKYIDLLEALPGSSTPIEGSLDIDRLAALAEESPALRSLLVSLTRFMQEDASKLGPGAK